jgi:hypothetical protein
LAETVTSHNPTEYHVSGNIKNVLKTKIDFVNNYF